MASRLKPSADTRTIWGSLGKTGPNQRQRLAVKCALEFNGPGVPAIANHPYVVFGPPGTGKDHRPDWVYPSSPEVGESDGDFEQSL